MDGGIMGMRAALQLAAVTTALVAGSVTASAAPAAEPTDTVAEVDNVAVLGQTMGTVSQDSAAGDVVLSVHGVRRITDGTVLYWSVGQREGESTTRISAGSRLWPNWFAYDRYGSNSEPRGVSVIDPVGRQVYEPLISGDGEACLCSDAKISNQAGDVTVLYAVMPALPEGATTVDVRLGYGSIIQGVPVEDGLLEPAAPAEGRIVLLGQRWPAIDQSAVSSSFEPLKAIYPLTSKQATRGGAVTTEENTEEVVISLASDVLFARDAAALSDTANEVVAAAAEKINGSASGGTLSIVGHTDSDAGTAYNRDLSERRAQSVAAALATLLTADVRVEVSGKGESQPIASNDTDRGKSLNRRVSLTFVPKGA